ncbi:MAG: long-chain fatty acid--CoA ligase [Desulfobacterales bacterium]|nr:long-chain fatty acid--CoA ligase [Desulfobacterales bacterium]MDJ0988569.1 long-chain fatty acid--CoA ligase [Desulfobacterales bacterium]
MHIFEKPDNLVELIENSLEKYPDNAMFGTKNRAGEYEWVTYREVGKRIDNLRSGLSQAGINRGDAVGIIANNCTEWAISAYATFGLGGRFIPMYEKELRKIWKHIINDGGIKLLLVATREIYDQIEAMRDELPALENVYRIEGQGENTMSGLEELGAARAVRSIHPQPEDIAVLIYTSGTTGDPKGVLLSHGNFTSNVLAGHKVFPGLNQHDRGLSILPWAHSFGQTGELYLYSHIGGSIGFMGDVTTLGDDMGKVQPTFLIAVPRVFNKIYAGLWAKMDAKGGLAKKLFEIGIAAAKERRQQSKKGQANFLTNLKFKIADAVVFNKIRARFGGRLTGALSGSATMNVEIGHFFSDLGIPVYDCYGLTETSPAATMNGPLAHKPGSVGRPIEHVRVAIDKVFSDGDEDGEIIIHGPNVMQGYHNKPEATKEVMTADGGFRTGDRGRLDQDGFLFITGRIKEQYKLENGKYVFPAAIEEEIKLHPLVENAMIHGEGQAFNVCLVVPDFVVLEKYATGHGMPTDPQALVQNKEIKGMISDEITKCLKGKFGGYEIPKKFIYLSENFSLDNGTLTQTMKLKRRAVLEQQKDQITKLYA